MLTFKNKINLLLKCVYFKCKLHREIEKVCKQQVYA